MKKLFLLGAITHNRQYKSDFEAAEQRLKEAGYSVVSPYRFCDEKMDWNKRLRKCMQVLSTCSNVAFIPSRCKSVGASLGLRIAYILNMDVKDVDVWIEIAERNKAKTICRNQKKKKVKK